MLKSNFKRFHLLAALVGVLVSGPVWEANAVENLSQTEKLAFANWHHEMVECHVYYLIAAQLLRNEPNQDKEAIKNLEQVTNTLLERIKGLGRAIGMLDEAVAAAMRLAYRQQLQEINNDFTLNSVNLAPRDRASVQKEPGVVGEVVLHETCDEIIRMVVTLLHA